MRLSAFATLLCSHMIYSKAPSKRKAPSPTPTPIPAFTPVLRPEEASTGEAEEDVDAGGDIPLAVMEPDGLRGGVVVDAEVVRVWLDVDVETTLVPIVVYSAQVFTDPLVEVIVKFPPTIPIPSLAR